MLNHDRVEPGSPYYPPRARWHSRIFNGYAVLRRIFFRQARRQRGQLLAHQVLLAFVIPAYGPWRMKRTLLASLLAAVYGLSLLGYLVWLGYLVGNLMYGLMIAVHAIGAVATFSRLRRDEGLTQRLRLTLTTLFLQVFLVYIPVAYWVHQHGFRPLLIHDRVIIVNPWRSGPPAVRGEWLGFRFDEVRFPGFRIQPGLGLGEVLGLPGERLEFFADRYEIDGMVYARKEGLPKTGDYRVPERHCFVWPILVRMDMDPKSRERVMEQFMKEVALAPESQWVGRPFTWWFFRHQELP